MGILYLILDAGPPAIIGGAVGLGVGLTVLKRSGHDLLIPIGLGALAGFVAGIYASTL